MMLPVSKNSTLDNHIRKPKAPPDPSSSTLHDHSTKSLYYYFCAPLSHYPRLCIFLFFLILFLYLPFLSIHRRSPNTSLNLNPNQSSDQCEFGKFYIYDLPAELNADFITNCDKISPWGSQCGALSNNGLGPQAAGLDHVIPTHLSRTWYWTDQFSLEVIFHNRLLHHTCRTMEPESATAYYIPFYGGLAVGKYLWGEDNFDERDMYCDMMLDWVQTKMPYYNRSKGLDHFLVMGRITWDFRRKNGTSWGSRCIFKRPMWNVTRLLIEREHRDYFDIGVPYPTGFHPETDNDVVLWQEFVRSRARHSLFCFVGGPRATFKNDFRGLLLSQCNDSGESCRSVDCTGTTRCSKGRSDILETFLDSDFCLQPRGDSYTRRSVFDCMVAGSIPVFFWKRTAYVQYKWFLPGEPESYSVFIHKDEVINGTSIKGVLQKFSIREVKKMREKVIEYIPKIIYAKPNDGLETINDAVNLAVDGVLKRLKEQKENEFQIFGDYIG